MMEECIYLDYAASTPLDERVLKAMLPWMTPSQPGNSHALHHMHGFVANEAVKMARSQVAGCIAASPEELVFTASATEANNLAIKGLIQHLSAIGKRHIITSAVEHSSVLEPLRSLANCGFRVDVLPVKPCGMIEASMVERAVTPQTGLVCIQAVNNETGTIQPISEIAAILQGRGIMFHTDATQAIGKVPFSVADTGVDLATFSAHKIYGPQGIGGLYVRRTMKKNLLPLIHGGGQESGLRSGTLPTALCVGFGAASTLFVDDRARLQQLKNLIVERLKYHELTIYGHSDPLWNVPGIICLRFPGIDHETLTMELPSLAFGLGAACSSHGNKYSHVIKAITGSEQAARETIRVSFGRFTSPEQVIQATTQIVQAVSAIKKQKVAA